MLSFMLILLLGSPNAQAQKVNTSIYEQEADQQKTLSFSAKVRVVREISDEVEVFFEGDKAKGAFTLPRSLPRYGELMKILEQSRKPGGAPVSITADEDKRIKTVEATQGGGGFQVPDDPNKKWDFGKIPD